MSRGGRATLLAGALAAALCAGFLSVRRVGEQVAVLEACDAANAGRWELALSGTEGRVDGSETGRSAAECRCRALLARGGADACAELLEDVLADPRADGWAPSPPLSAHLINTRRVQGRSREAAELAQRAARQHPEDADLFYLELLTRSALEDEGALLAELAERIPPRGPAAARMRTSLANRHLLRGDAVGALAALGDAPPAAAGAARSRWFELRGMAEASLGDLAGLEQTYARWRAAGGDPRELRGRLALTLSIANLRLGDRSPLERLREALAEPLEDPALEEALTIRLILTLVNDGRRDEALATYDRAAQRFELAGLARSELERSTLHEALASGQDLRARLRFRVSPPLPGGELLVSPRPDEPLDAPYRRIALPASGEVEVERRLGPAPLRWVLRDGQGRVRGSGTAQPRAGALSTGRAGSPLEVPVTPRQASPPEPAALSRRPGDGHRRVAAVLLDCADWRIVQYLRARGELPVLSALLEKGPRAVLESDPPLTAAALEALVWPARSARPSFVGLLHRFGVELAGLSSVGANPLGALEWVLPEARDIFSVVGEGRRSAANLLFAHGSIRSGRHAVVTGPRGVERRVPVPTSARDLAADERRRFPALAAVSRERDAVHLRTIAAELDVAREIAASAEVDLLLLRVEPLDILTHAHFAEAVRSGQDDGRGLLFSVYRYIDARLAEVHDALDSDDVLVVFSDHGIRTAMEHSRWAFFVASGPGLPRGRAGGTPALRGVSRVFADLLGIETGWPDTGVAPWASRLAPPALARADAAREAPPTDR